MCNVRASSASSYSRRIVTRREMYSNTSETPWPVFADVKNSFGRRSGGGGGLNELDGESAEAGVVDSVVARSRRKRLGVIVGALETEEDEGWRRGVRVGE